jgi:Ca-activated chloride channel family protein
MRGFRVFVGACAALLLSSFLAFSDGIIIPIPPPDAPPQAPWLTIVYHRVTVQIEGGVAITHVDQEFRNDHPFPVEGTYVFPLPPGAVVQRFALWVDGQPVEGEVLPADQARELYLDYLRRHRDPALLEYVGRDTFRARVFPIPPGGTRRIELEYAELLAPEGGVYRYRYPLDTERFSHLPLEEVRIEVELRGPTPPGAVYSPSHRVTVLRPEPSRATVEYSEADVLPDRDFLLYYSFAEETVGLTLITYAAEGEDGWFLLLVNPALARGAPIPKDIVLVIDKSGSMEGEKIEQAKAAARYILEHLGEGDRFGLIAFNEEVARLTEGLVEATPDRISAAVAEVEEIYADGWTNIHGALLAAMEWLSPSGRPKYVIFLTDGLPTAGETDTGRIVQDVTAANSAGARLFVFGVGYDVDPQLLDLLAQGNRGTASYVTPQEDLEGVLTAFYAKIAQPALTELSLEIRGVTPYDHYPRELPDLFYGEQLTLVGRYAGAGPATIALTGTREGAEETYVLEAEFPQLSEAADFLPRLWAARKVGYLLKRVVMEGESEELVQQIIQLATRYGIATPYTSFLVEEDAGAALPPAYFSTVRLARSAQKLAAAEAPGETGGVKEVGGRVFLLVDGVWQESTYQEGTETLDIQYLSEAYFQLLSELPEIAPILALGEEVIFQLGDRFVRVGPVGLSELTPEQLAELKGK